MKTTRNQFYYSPGVDSADFDPFLASKFNLSKEGGILKSKLKGNSLKYFNYINGFLEMYIAVNSQSLILSMQRR